MSTTSDLLALYVSAAGLDADTEADESEIAGLRAVAAAAWEEGVQAVTIGRTLNGQMKLTTGPNPYSQNALISGQENV